MSGKLLHSFVWDFAGRIIGQIISFIIGIILARLLSPAEFGLIGMAMVFIAMSEIFTNLGLSSALIQRETPTEDHYSSSFYLNLIASIFLSLLFILLAPFIASFFKSPEITNIIRVLALTLVVSGFTVVQEARLRKFMHFKILTEAKLLSSVLAGSIGIFMAWQGYGVWSLVFQTLLSRILISIYYWFVTDWKPKLIFKLKAIKDLWSYSFNLFISGIIDTTYNQLDSIIIARAFSAFDLGLYTRAKSLNGFVIKYSSESLNSVTFPAMAAIKDDKNKMLELGMKAETLIAFVSFGLLGWLYVAAEPLILTLLGQKWESSISIFKILCLSGFIYPLSAATLSMLKAAGFTGEFLKVEILKKIIGLIGLGIGFLFGLKGFLISLIFSGAICLWLNMFFTGRAIGISVKHQALPLLPYMAIASILALIISSLDIRTGFESINFLILTALFFLTYFVSNMFLKTSGYYSFKMQMMRLTNKFKLKKVVA